MKKTALHPLTFFVLYLCMPLLFVPFAYRTWQVSERVLHFLYDVFQTVGVCLLIAGIASGVYRWINDRRAAFLSVVGVLFCLFALVVKTVVYIRTIK